MESVGGTSISSLKQHQQYAQYNAHHNLQAEQGHNAAHNIHQNQHDAYYNIDADYPRTNNSNYAHIENVATPMPDSASLNKNGWNIEDLAKDISNNLPSPDSDNDVMMRPIIVDSEEFPEINVPDVVKQYGGYLNFLPIILREPLIIVVLFILLSQDYVRVIIGRYLRQINPNAQGRVSFAGILTYGILLATLFSLTKRYVM